MEPASENESDSIESIFSPQSSDVDVIGSDNNNESSESRATNSAAVGEESESKIGLIVGIVLGLVALFVAICVAIWIIKRKENSDDGESLHSAVFASDVSSREMDTIATLERNNDTDKSVATLASQNQYARVPEGSMLPENIYDKAPARNQYDLVLPVNQYESTDAAL